MIIAHVSILVSTLCIASGKIYKRCELARELRNFDVPDEEIPTWVCIAQHESNYDTAAQNPGSGDHGLFQISQMYWCSPPGNGYGCNSPCSKFRDDDIADDLQCIRRIYNEHKRISGDGYNAWVVYPLYCKGDNSKYIQSCFDEESFPSPTVPISNITENEISTEDDYGDGYNFPPLPTPSKNHEAKVDYGDGYEFPKLPYSKSSINDFTAVRKSAFEKESQRESKVLDQKSPMFPFSKSSIYDSISVGEKKQEDFKLLDKKLPIFPFSRSSIHDSISVGEKKQEDRVFPFSKASIHHFVQVEDGKNGFPKSIYSKQSIHHFVPVSGEFEKEQHTMKDTTTTPFVEATTSETPIRKIFNKVQAESKATYSAMNNYTTTMNPSYSKPNSRKTAQIPTTSQYKMATKKSKPTPKPNPTLKPSLNTFSKPATTDIKSTPKERISSSHPHISNTQPSTSSKSPFSTTTNSYAANAKDTAPSKFFIQKSSSFATTPKPNFISSSFRKAKIKDFLDLEEPAFRFSDLKGASSTLTPYRTVYKPSTPTTNKPYLTNKPFTTQKPLLNFTSKPISAKTTPSTIKPYLTNKPLTTQKPLLNFTSKPISAKTTPSTIKPYLTNKPLTTQKPLLNFTSKPISAKTKPHSTTKKPTIAFTYAPLTTKKMSPTTPTPNLKQITFAPDSFFTWLFGSQTLPPLVPPIRPSRPPGGSSVERPTIRPIGEERPPNLPRPPGLPLEIPGAPQVTVTSTRPIPSRPNPITRPTRHQQQRPFGPMSPMRRPFRPGNTQQTPVIQESYITESTSKFSTEGSKNLETVTSDTPTKEESPSSLSSITRPTRPQQQIPFGLMSPIRRPFRPDSTLRTPVSQESYVTQSTSKFSTEGSKNSKNATSDSPTKKESSRNLGEKEIEVKLDEHFVFVRTKYGYRLSWT